MFPSAADDKSGSGNNSHMSTAAVAGIASGVALAVAVAVYGIVTVIRRRRSTPQVVTLEAVAPASDVTEV